MRLVRLSLLNFRQHADTVIEFGTGVIGIVGPNGAGKTTILEAIAWAIYGSSAARGTNDTIRFSRAPVRSRVEVELVFTLAAHEFRVVRTLGNAEVFLDGDPVPVATTLGGATAFLQRRLGMTREEFFNTYFTGQKELQFLAQMGPTQRGRFLGQVLGYERLRVAQDRARARRGELRHETEGLRSALPDPRELAGARVAAGRRRRDAQASTTTAEAEQRSAAAAAAEAGPRWSSAQAAREAARDAERDHRLATAEAETAERELARLNAELETVGRAEAELAPLCEALLEMPPLMDECAMLARIAVDAERRRGLAQAERTALEELARLAEREAQLEPAPALLRLYRQEMEAVREELATAEQGARSAQAAWSGDRGESEAKLRTYRDRAQELKEQIQQLRQAGPDGVCPMCERPLGGEFDRVVGHLQEEWDRLVQDGRWLKRRVEQLKQPPPEVTAAEERRGELQRTVEERAQRLARCERAVQELEQLRGERPDRERRLDEVRRNLAAAPAEYDPQRHRAAEARLSELRAIERRAAALEQAASGRGALETSLREAGERAAAARDRLEEAERRRTASTLADRDYEESRAAAEAALARLHAAELLVTELRGQLATAAEALESATKAEAAYRERRAALQRLELELRLHNELDDAFTRLRAELNARVRPELSELASGFLAQITDGRYTSLDIDESYEIMVLDEGEEKPVISGGEEDVANLVLRLAVSQMIAERAGYPLSILILDEVFGSLDIERRDNVIQLLHRLGDRFEQVILITHIETVREGLDRVIRVEFDERSGASRVGDGT